MVAHWDDLTAVVKAFLLADLPAVLTAVGRVDHSAAARAGEMADWTDDPKVGLLGARLA